ncbi:MAG TPA: peptidylprolyl isomerase [Candidatus Brocadiia bacterium]|nr:peptidylprolyl isomerase [Planctomycetota bacterium]MDO8092255.1 peptidylprolyl isomerase [Candidatus Brocadiales bacterium]
MLKFSNVVLLCGFIVFCVGTRPATADKAGAIVAVVNDEIITEYDVAKRAAIAVVEAEKKYSGAELDQIKRQLAQEVINELIDRKVLVIEAERVFGGDESKKEEINKELDSFLKGAVREVGSISKFYEIANSQGINPAEKKVELREDLMIDKIMREHVYTKVSVPPKDVRKYYNEHIKEYQEEKRVKLRHILIKFSGYNTKEDAKWMAKQLLGRLKQGEDFATLAENYSQEPSALRGGLWDFDEVDSLRKELRDEAFRMKDGEISPILESSVGYHIIKIEESKPTIVRSFQSVQEEIFHKLEQEYSNNLKKAYIERLKQNVVIKRFD